jgi:hypothetical protein
MKQYHETFALEFTLVADILGIRKAMGAYQGTDDVFSGRRKNERFECVTFPSSFGNLIDEEPSPNLAIWIVAVYVGWAERRVNQWPIWKCAAGLNIFICTLSQ